LEIIASTGNSSLALIYIGKMSGDRLVELGESIQPPKPREQKWVLLISTLFGCPVGCKICDAAGYYEGKLSKDEILDQIDFLIRKRYPSGEIPCKQFKIQFSRMGEPSLNPSMLDVLNELLQRYVAPGLVVSLSTVAPCGTQAFFECLHEIKQEKYSGGHFQLQFSIHTTSISMRDQLIPIRKWDFKEIAKYGERFYTAGDRKVALNFALTREMPVDADILLSYFDPAIFLIKITPLNPTYRARDSQLTTYLSPVSVGEDNPIVRKLRAAGYQVIVSIGEVEENYIGSNCGQCIRRHMQDRQSLRRGYTYAVQEYG